MERIERIGPRADRVPPVAGGPRVRPRSERDPRDAPPRDPRRRPSPPSPSSPPPEPHAEGHVDVTA